jgi:RNA polymerase sigma-70 factor (ECF subfamily)
MAPLSGRRRQDGSAGGGEVRERVLLDGDDLRRFLGGEAAAFAAILARHQSPLLRYATNRLGAADPSRAEDAVQETFLRLLREAPALNGSTLVDGSLAAWLFRVCRNVCADVSRKEVRMQQRHQLVAVPELAPGGTLGVELLQGNEERGKVKQLLHELPDREREVLTLKILEGKSYREIQALLGTTLHDVFTTAHRALRKLADGMRAAGLA